MRTKFLKQITVVISVFLCIPFVAGAQVRITEIMYDTSGTDTGREWIEVYNEGSEPVDLSLWKLFEGNVAHKLTPLGSVTLGPLGYAIIADVPSKFQTDNPSYTGLLFDSVFSLGNEGETLIMRNPDGVDVDTVSYMSAVGGQGDGMSLQKTWAGTWIAASPTVGSATTQTVSETTPDPEPQTTEGVDEPAAQTSTKNPDVYSSHSSQTIANVSFDAPEFVVTSGRQRIGFVGAPLVFEAKVQSMKNIPLGNVAGFSWSWGDGFQSSGQFVSHTYEYPGDYIAILNSSMGGADAVSKVKIKILSPKVSITAATNSSVEITNGDVYELNIGGWWIETAGERRVIPQDTVLSKQVSVHISAKALGLRGFKDYVRLINPAGVEVSRKEISSYVAGGTPDPVVLLPDGMTEAVFRQRLIQAAGVYGGL